MNNYKYQSVIDFIYKIIASANTNSLQQLPSERTISSILNVSRTTVKYAIDLLVDDRILYKVQGKGTFIRSDLDHNKIVISKDSPDAFHSNVKSRGLKSTSKVLSFKVLYDYEKLKDIFFEVKDFYELIRIRSVENQFTSIEYCYFPFHLFSDANRYDFSKVSLYEYMNSKKMNPVSFLKSIECVYDKKISEKLNLDNADFLLYQTYLGKNSSGDYVEYTKSYSEYQNMEFGFEVTVGS